MKNITIRMDDALMSDLIKVAQLEDRSISGAIRHILKKYCSQVYGTSLSTLYDKRRPEESSS